MLSYRHGYHAGNHADILKHMILCLILRSLNQKDKPYTIIDTHSGAGLYDLSSSFSQKNLEFDTGFSLVKDDAKLKELVPEFYEVVEKALTMPGASKQMYPGSPFFSSVLARNTDTIFLRDLHEAEYHSLCMIFERKRNVHIEHADGFKSLAGLLPPLKRRGLILIDPSYEIKHDYVEVVKAVKFIKSRFPQAIVAIWYPVLARLNDHSKKLAHDLSRLDMPLTKAEIRVCKQEEDFGMCGSGMLIVNPPYSMDESLEKVVMQIAKTLTANLPKEGVLATVEYLVERT